MNLQQSRPLHALQLYWILGLSLIVRSTGHQSTVTGHKTRLRSAYALNSWADRVKKMISSLDLELLREMNEFSEPLSDTEPDVLQSYIDNPPHQGPLSGFNYDYKVDDDESENIARPTSLSNQERPRDYTLPQDIGGWPQRLLHVPTMTSYEWAPGNTYGEYVAPRYNAISYTWGRYDLQYMVDVSKEVLRDTRSIAIGGIPWADDVPRVHPRHFSTSDFSRVINRTLIISSSLDTEFVWVDVACIDQRNGPQKDAEIGRQASIFKGAEAVFVWLTRHTASRIETILKCLSKCTSTWLAYRSLSTCLIFVNRTIQRNICEQQAGVS